MNLHEDQETDEPQADEDYGAPFEQCTVNWYAIVSTDFDDGRGVDIVKITSVAEENRTFCGKDLKMNLPKKDEQLRQNNRACLGKKWFMPPKTPVNEEPRQSWVVLTYFKHLNKDGKLPKFAVHLTNTKMENQPKAVNW